MPNTGLNPGQTPGRAARDVAWTRAQYREPPTMSKRYSAVFAMCIFAGSSRQMAPRQMATRLNQSSSRGERDAHDTTLGNHDMTVGAAKGEPLTAKHSQRLSETHGTKVSNSEPKFRLQARGWPLRRRSPTALTHSRSGLGSGGRVCPWAKRRRSWYPARIRARHRERPTAPSTSRRQGAAAAAPSRLRRRRGKLGCGKG